MELSQDVLLPILIVTIVANVAIVTVLMASGRIGHDKRVASTAHASGFEHTIMSSSYADDPVPSAWPAPDPEVDGGPPTDPVAADGPTIGVIEPALAIAPDAPIVDDGIDELTGLPDASAFQRLIADEEARMARYHRTATVVVVELEGLERLVERLGQEAADRLLPPVADTLRRLARSADHVARVGPGRFGVLLPETDEISAINYIERVRRACELWLESGAIALRLAIGWAGTSGDPTLTEARRTATDRMYVELRRTARRAGADDDSDLIAS